MTTNAERYTTVRGQVIEYPAPSPEVRAFLTRCIQAANDPRVSEADLVELIYSKENPILDQTVFPGRGAVTREVFDDPLYLVISDLIDQKRALTGDLDVEASKAMFQMTVAEVAEELGVTPGAVRQACQTSKLTAVKKGGVYLIDPRSVQTYRSRVHRRGPKPKPALTIRMGAKAGSSFRVKAAILEVLGSSKGVVEAVVPHFDQVAVAFSGKEMNRLFILEPADEPNRFDFNGFSIEGNYRVAEKVNDARAAGRRFRAFAPYTEALRAKVVAGARAAGLEECFAEWKGTIFTLRAPKPKADHWSLRVDGVEFELETEPAEAFATWLDTNHFRYATN